ncbi:putative quinol monooxygenase [Fictibacillus iocasae]|uniref:Quinol monooxygenase n=1 Tax=Fictibacillus iocasae TaxID=2715437 RepID=A0ABW2NSX4_9BACL
MMYGLYGKLTAYEGKRDELAAVLLEAAQSMEAVDHCFLYVVNVSETEPDAVFIYEVWRDQSAHQASLQLDSVKTLIQNGKPLIAGMERMSILNPIGGKGLSK